jgi:hypothetical protein
LGPRAIDLVLPDSFISIPEMQSNESNESSEVFLRRGLSKIRNRHGILPSLV